MIIRAGTAPARISGGSRPPHNHILRILTTSNAGTVLLKSSPPLTLNAITRILELKRSALKYWCPEECEMITVRYRDYKASIGSENRKRRRLLLADILEECAQNG
jgi:hypothetical protein